MIRIVIAEDQEMLLGVIGSLLNLEEDMEVVGLAKNGEEAVTLVGQLQPDICIMDMEMPEMSGLEAADMLMSTECKIILLTTFARSGNFELARNAGVNGYLLKDRPIEELVNSIRSIIDGKQLFSSELMDDVPEKQMEVLEILADSPLTTKTSNKKYHKMKTLRDYFITIIDKMKLPTG